MKKSFIIYYLLTMVATSVTLNAQDGNYFTSLENIEKKFYFEPINIIDQRGSRFRSDHTLRVTMKWSDGLVTVAKLKQAPIGGTDFNNEPRYELAAYEIQKLFLTPDEYVVPPTTARTLPLEQYKNYDKYAAKTFDEAESVLFVIQHWLANVSNKKIFDKQRLKTDPLYERYVGNLNILTYLIKHSDSNDGNMLISTLPESPKLFSVDNGVAFRSEESDRGTFWKNIKVDRLPKDAVDKLRLITMDNLKEKLSVIAQFGLSNGYLIDQDPGESLNSKRGVVKKDGIIQFGLTNLEIKEIYERLVKLLKRIDKNELELIEK